MMVMMAMMVMTLKLDTQDFQISFHFKFILFGGAYLWAMQGGTLSRPAGTLSRPKGL